MKLPNKHLPDHRYNPVDHHKSSQEIPQQNIAASINQISSPPPHFLDRSHEALLAKMKELSSASSSQETQARATSSSDRIQGSSNDDQASSSSAEKTSRYIPLKDLKIEPSLLKTLEERIKDIGDPNKIIGETITSGGNGTIYQCKFDDQLLIKQNYDHSTHEILKKEAEYFNYYYGDDSACVVLLNNLPTLIMVKIEGTVLSKLNINDIPEDLILLVQQMLERLRYCGIHHDDLHIGNIIYNPCHHAVFPIDITNSYDSDMPKVYMDTQDRQLMLDIQRLINLKS